MFDVGLHSVLVLLKVEIHLGSFCIRLYCILNILNFLLIQVKDTVQVDQNVSRHLPDELSRHDWDLLVSLIY